MKSVSVFVLVVSFLMSAVAFAASAVVDEELGQVVAVKRTFKIDLADCGKNYSVGKTDIAFGSCAVKVGEIADDEWENLILGFYNKSTFTPGTGKKVEVELTARGRGYIIMVHREGPGDMDFVSVKGYIQEAIDQIRGEIPITLQIIKKI
jgi:hypothetical protein